MMSYASANEKSQAFYEMFKALVRDYGVLVRAIEPESIGEAVAFRIACNLEQSGGLMDRQTFSRLLGETIEDTMQPTNSCGAGTNELLELILGEKVAKAFKSQDVVKMSEDAGNLKALLCTDDGAVKVVKLDVARKEDDYVQCVRIINTEIFDEKKSETNIVYVFKDKILYLKESPQDGRRIIMLEDDKRACDDIYKNLGPIVPRFEEDGFSSHMLFDPDFDPDDESDQTLRVVERKLLDRVSLGRWTDTHSFTLQTCSRSPAPAPLFHPYQCYAASHTMQQWFQSDKDVTLCEAGFESYCDNLSQLVTTEDTKIRTTVYAQLFALPCDEEKWRQTVGTIGEKCNRLRISFKVKTVDLALARANLDALTSFIDSIPGSSPQIKLEHYKKTILVHCKLKLQEYLAPKEFAFFCQDPVSIKPELKIFFELDVQSQDDKPKIVEVEEEDEPELLAIETQVNEHRFFPPGVEERDREEEPEQVASEEVERSSSPLTKRD